MHSHTINFVYQHDHTPAQFGSYVTSGLQRDRH